LLGASIDVKCGDEALSIIDTTVFLANLFRTSDLLCSLDTLEAVKRAGCLRLEASLKVASSDHAFAKIDAAVPLAETKVASHDCCQGAAECKQNLSH
jgi:hypothetical protein